MKRSLTASCFFAVKVKKWSGQLLSNGKGLVPSKISRITARCLMPPIVWKSFLQGAEIRQRTFLRGNVRSDFSGTNRKRCRFSTEWRPDMFGGCGQAELSVDSLFFQIYMWHTSCPRNKNATTPTSWLTPSARIRLTLRGCCV